MINLVSNFLFESQALFGKQLSIFLNVLLRFLDWISCWHGLNRSLCSSYQGSSLMFLIFQLSCFVIATFGWWCGLDFLILLCCASGEDFVIFGWRPFCFWVKEFELNRNHRISVGGLIALCWRGLGQLNQLPLCLRNSSATHYFLPQQKSFVFRFDSLLDSLSFQCYVF